MSFRVHTCHVIQGAFIHASAEAQGACAQGMGLRSKDDWDEWVCVSWSCSSPPLLEPLSQAQTCSIDTCHHENNSPSFLLSAGQRGQEKPVVRALHAIRSRRHLCGRMVGALTLAWAFLQNGAPPSAADSMFPITGKAGTRSWVSCSHTTRHASPPKQMELYVLHDTTQ